MSSIPVAYKFGCFCLHPSEKQLLREGKPVPLAPKVYDTLLLLLESQGRLLEKSELLNRLWPGSFVEVAARAHVRLVSPEFHLITKRKMQAAREAGIGVIAWTPNRPRQWRRLIAAGVEAIITDDPAGLAALLDSQP